MAALNKLRNDGVHIALPYKISPVLSESQPGAKGMEGTKEAEALAGFSILIIIRFVPYGTKLHEGS